MKPLFTKADFSLFTDYAGKSQEEAPEAYALLRPMYDKLGRIIDGLRLLGYYCEIKRHTLTQSQKYNHYHWARVYPKDRILRDECIDKVFFVVGTTEEGVNIHIDSYSSKGYRCNDIADEIKEHSWLQITPDKASSMTCEELIAAVETYIDTNSLNFLRFASQFRIKTSINALNDMNIDNIINILKKNGNLILTGAPGTGKTFLARRIAAKLGATEENGQCVMVQFHPSYDYTDFVEGLRPVKNDGGDNIVFDRRNGIFKDFCKAALQNFQDSEKTEEQLNEDEAFKNAYDELLDRIDEGILTELPLKTGTTNMRINGTTVNHNIILSTIGNGSKRQYIVSFNRLKKLSQAYKTYQDLEKQTNIYQAVVSIIKGCHSSAYWATLHYLYKNIYQTPTENKAKIERKDYIFIIDEINRGEISKIFGELFFCIDPGYRGVNGRVRTQYQNLIEEGDDFESGFFIPENVYIIGTMNDIDRSVESMDFAMRRRFAWHEVTAADSQNMLSDDKAWPDGLIPSADTVIELKNRMTNLNNAIIDRYKPENATNNERIGLTPAYQIGASYFLKYALYNDFDMLWDNHLKGLLYEYLRGTSGIEAKLEALHKAYNDTESS